MRSSRRLPLVEECRQAIHPAGNRARQRRRVQRTDGAAYGSGSASAVYGTSFATGVSRSQTTIEFPARAARRYALSSALSSATRTVFSGGFFMTI